MEDLKKFFKFEELNTGDMLKEYEDKDYEMSEYSVNEATGSFCIEQADMVLEDITGEFKLIRRYDSQVEIYGWVAGCRWIFNIESVLIILNNQVMVVLPDSHVEKFDVTMSGYYNVDQGSGYFLMDREDGGYVLFEKEAVKQYDYNAFGKIETITDKNGNKTEFVYNGNMLLKVVLASGQSLSMSYDDAHLLGITDNSGRSVVYQYEGDYLVRVLYPDNTSILYKYYNDGTIKGVVNKNGIEYIYNEFDQNGRITIQTRANGSFYKYIYDDRNMVNSKYDGLYDTWTNYWYNDDCDITKIEYFDNTYEKFEYDYQGNLIAKTDRNGYKTEYAYDNANNCVKEVYPNGLIVNKDYNEAGLLYNVSDNSGKEERREYDDRGNLILKTEKINNDSWKKHEYEYDDKGRLILDKDSKGNVTRYEYNTLFSKPNVVINRCAQSVMYEYDVAGRTTRKYSDNFDLRFEYDVFNRITKITDGEGNITRYNYNRDGKLSRKIMPNQYNNQNDSGKGIVYEYDKDGKLVKTINPSGAIHLTKRNSDGKIIKEVMPGNFNPSSDDGEGTMYEYDRNGNCIRIIRPDKTVIRMFYDACGNMVKKVPPNCYIPKDDDGEGYTYSYDSMNRLIKETDPKGRVVKYITYDYAGRIIKEVGMKGYKSEKTDKNRKGIIRKYDCIGNVIEEREYAKQETPGFKLVKYEYDTEGFKIKEIRYLEYQMETGAVGKTGIYNYVNDEEGRMIKQLRPCGGLIEYGYDECGRKIFSAKKINEKMTQWQKYIYNKSGRVSMITMSSDPRFTKKQSVDILYRYDKNGNIVEVVTPKGNSIRRTFDADNRVIEVEHVDAVCDIDNKMSYAYDNNGNLSMEVDIFGITKNYYYDSMNRIVREVNEYGGTTAYAYDVSGNVIKKVMPEEFKIVGAKARGFTYEYDIMGNLIKETSPMGEVIKQCEYNEFDELITEKDAAGSETEFKYDFKGRRTSYKYINGDSSYSAFDPFGNVIASHDGKYRMTGYELDDEGNTLSILHPDGRVEKFEYDLAGNMTMHIDTSGNITGYSFNEINKMISKVFPNGAEERYAYDEEGNLAIFADRNKNGIENTYNIYGELVNRKDMRTGLTVKNTFFIDGKIKNSQIDGVRTGYEYDKQGHIARRKLNEKIMAEFIYDIEGRIKKIRSGSGKKVITYEYDLSGRITKITDGQLIIAENIYNMDSTIKQTKLGEGKVVIDYKYNRHKKKTQISANMASGERVVDSIYKYDESGYCTSLKSVYGDFSAEYDINKNPEKVQYLKYNEKICYDNNGLRTRRNVVNKNNNNNSYAEFYNYVQDKLSEKITTDPFGNMIGRIAYQYDKSGNIINDGENTYYYDCFGRLIKSETADGYVMRYHYDLEMLRYEVEDNGETTQYIYDEKGHVIRMQNSHETILYIWDNDNIVALYHEDEDQYMYFIRDNNESITHIVDGNFVINSYTYDIFGTIIGVTEGVTNNILYKQHMYDENTGLYYMNNNYYNPSMDLYIMEKH